MISHGVSKKKKKKKERTDLSLLNDKEDLKHKVLFDTHTDRRKTPESLTIKVEAGEPKENEEKKKEKEEEKKKRSKPKGGKKKYHGQPRGGEEKEPRARTTRHRHDKGMEGRNRTSN